MLQKGNGDCDAWAYFMADCCKSHGISASNKHLDASDPADGVVVKNVTFGDEYSAGPPRKTFLDDNDPVSGIKGVDISPTGIAGQGMQTPGQKVFNYHAVTERSGTPYYDPAYMTTWASEAAFRNDLAATWRRENINWYGTNYYNVPLAYEPPQ